MGATIARVVSWPAASASTVDRRIAGRGPDPRTARRRSTGPATPTAPASAPAAPANSARSTVRTAPPDVAGVCLPDPIRRIGVPRARDVPLEFAAARPTGPGPPAADWIAGAGWTHEGGLERRIQ